MYIYYKLCTIKVNTFDVLYFYYNNVFTNIFNSIIVNN